LKITIIGAGGVGGYFGARLAAAGEDVTFIARGAHLEAMRRDGLRILSPLGDLALTPTRAESDPARAGVADLVVLAVKLWSTEEALQSARALLGPATSVVSFQNGVEAAGLAAKYLGPPRVLGGVAHIGAVIDRPGVVRQTGALARLTFGELDGSPTPRATAFLEACRRAAIDAHLSDDIQRAVWEKFVFLVGVSGMTCLTRKPIGPIRTDPATRGMLHDAMDEVVSVARAKGIALPADTAERQLQFCDTLVPGMKSSMLGDLERGNRLEVDWLAGAVVRMGVETGVTTPVNLEIYTALKPYADGTRG
jgi:2-dehydropantoate 2-reductase